MPHHAAFHLGLPCLLLHDRMHYNLKISTCDPLKIQNGQFHTYSINMHGEINKKLFDLILYVPVNNFSVMSGRVFLG